MNARNRCSKILTVAGDIDGIPCAAGSGPGSPRTSFYEDGRLNSAMVAETITYRGQTIRKGQRIELKADGSIKSNK